MAHDNWDMFASLTGEEFFVIDELSSPLLPLVALLYFLTQLATTRGKARGFRLLGLCGTSDYVWRPSAAYRRGASLHFSPSAP